MSEIYKVQVSVHDGIAADVPAAVGAEAGLKLVGFAARESAGVPAITKARILNGVTVAGGTEIVPITLPASGFATGWFWPGIAADNGLTINWASGTMDLDLFYLVN